MFLPGDEERPETARQVGGERQPADPRLVQTRAAEAVVRQKVSHDRRPSTWKATHFI